MNGHNRAYEEVILNSTLDSIHTTVLKIIRVAARFLKNTNATPSAQQYAQNLEQIQIIQPIP